MTKRDNRPARTMMAGVSVIAMCAVLPTLAAAQTVLTGAPGQGLVAGVITADPGQIVDGGPNAGVSVYYGSNAVVTVTGATINNSNPGTSSGLFVADVFSASAATPLSVVFTGVNNISAAGYGVYVAGLADTVVDLTVGGSTYTATGNGPGYAVNAQTNGGNVTLLNGANTLNGVNAGLYARNNGSGSVTVASAGGVLNASTGMGINASSNGGSVFVGQGGGITSAINAGMAGISANTSGTGSIDISTGSGGTINAGFYGIAATASGSGSVNVTVGDTISGALLGGGVSAQAILGSVNVTANAQITSGGTAIFASIGAGLGSTGDINISSVGLTSLNGLAVQGSAGPNSTGSVRYELVGANVVNGAVLLDTQGPGGLTAVAADAGASLVSNGFGLGLSANNGPVTIDWAGSITAANTAVSTFTRNGLTTINVGGPIVGSTGIQAQSQGSGDINLGTANDRLGSVTGTTFNGVWVQGTTGAVNIFGTEIAGTTGFAGGLTVTTNTGAINVDLSGALTAAGNGAFITSGGGAVTLDLGSVNANGGVGVQVLSGGGAITVNASGDIRAGGGRGVNVSTQVNSGAAVNIGSATERLGGAVTASGDGIFATGGGAISVYAQAVTAGGRGVVVSSQFTAPNGAVVVDVSGPIIAGAGHGVISNSNGVQTSSTNTVRVGAVTSTGGSAIATYSNGGDTSIIATGALSASTGNNASWTGLYAEARNGGNIDATALSSVFGSYRGIDLVSIGVAGATTSGVGRIELVATGPISGGQSGVGAVTNGVALLGTSGERLGAVTVLGNVAFNNTVPAGGAGVYANAGGGVSIYGTSVTSLGGSAATLTNNLVSGVSAVNGFGVAGISAGGPVTIDFTGAIVGGGAGGVLAQTSGTGAIVINTGVVTAAAGRGIDANGGSGAITINASGAVSAATRGIYAVNNGPGAITITTGSTVIAAGGTGIGATNNGAGSVSIGTAAQRLGGTVTASADGLFATGGGDVSVYGAGITAGNRGVVAASQFTNPNGRVIIDLTGPVTAGNFGVIGVNNGALSSNTLSINLAGAVSSVGGSAVSAQTNAGDILISTGAVTANAATNGARGDGVYAQAQGDALIGITTNGAALGYYGVYAATAGSGARGGIDILTRDSVTGVTEIGVFASATGGFVNVTTEGQVTGARGGVHAITVGGAGSIAVTTGNVTATTGAAVSGFIDGAGTGDVTMTVTGPARIEGWAGLSAATNGSGDVTVTALDAGSLFIGGNGPGLSASASGGRVSINVAGDIFGTGMGGLLLSNTGTGAIDARLGGDVTGAQGVVAVHTGTGSISLGSAGQRIGGAVYGSNGAGIYAAGGGDVSVFANAVTGVGGLAATLATNGGVTGALETSGFGVIGLSSGGSVTLDLAGPVLGGLGGGVLAQSGGGAVSITTGTVTADFGRAIEAGTTTGAVTITANGAVSGGQRGIYALSDSGAITITTGSTVTGLASSGVVASTLGAGAISIGTASHRLGGLVTGGTDGIFAVGAGDVSVHAAGVTAGNRGIVAASQFTGPNGRVVIDVAGAVNAANSFGIIGVNNGLLAGNTISITTAGPVTSRGGSGISAQSRGGDITIVSGAVTANSGPNGTWDGIFADGRGDSLISVTTNGAVSGTFNGVDAVSYGATARSGVVIAAGGSVTGGTGNTAILATLNGLGSATIGTASGTTVLAAGGTGIFANALGTTDATNLTISNLATIGGAGAAQVRYGILAQTAQGNAGAVVINSTGGAIFATDLGISGFSSAGTVNIGGENGIGSAINTTGTGIYGGTGAGQLTIRTGVGGTISPGAQIGIHGYSASGSILIDQAGAIGLPGADGMVHLGIYAQIASGAGDLIINSTGAMYITPGTGLQSAGVYAVHGGTGAVSVTTSGVIDPGAYGVVAQGGGAVTYAATGGLVEGGIGAYVASTGAGPVTVSSTASRITGLNGAGLTAVSAGGQVGVTTAGAVSGTTDGIVAQTSGAGRLSLINNGTVVGSGGVGIAALGGTGLTSVIINGAVSGGASGVVASSSGAGSTSVAVNAPVFGAGVSGINITSGTGGLLLNVNANVISTNGAAIHAVSAAGGVINIGGNAVVAGRAGPDSGVINLATASGATSTVNVGSGATIQSTSGSVTDVAIRATGGSVVVNNSGNLVGRVDFSALTGSNTGSLQQAAGTTFQTGGVSTFGAGDDTFTNAGQLVTLGTPTVFNFQGGTNVFNNNGTVFVGFNPVAPGGSTFTLNQLTAFNNAGTLQMMNSVVGDSIVAPGAAFVGSGSSRLSIDTVIGAPGSRSDILSVGSTSGVTRVLINDISTGFGAFNPDGVVIVTGTTNPGNFVLDAGSSWYNPDLFGGAIDKPGLFFSQLAVDPASRATVLVSAPKLQAYQFSTLGVLAQTVVSEAAARSDRQESLRDHLDGVEETVQSRAGFWARVGGTSADREAGGSYGSAGTTYVYDTSYSQEVQSATVGYDAVVANRDGSGGWAWGVSAGYAASETDFDQASSGVVMNGLVFGGYASYLRDGIFAAASVGTSTMDAKLKAPLLTGYASQHTDVGSVSASGEAGVRMPFLWGSILEPSVGLAYVASSIDDVAAAGSTVRFDDPESLRVSIGARMVGDIDDGDGAWRTRYTVSARLVDEVRASNDLVILGAGPNLLITDNFPKTFGELRAGITGESRTGWTGFGDVRLRFNDRYTETGLSVGVRLRY